MKLSVMIWLLIWNAMWWNTIFRCDASLARCCTPIRGEWRIAYYVLGIIILISINIALICLL